MTTALITGIGGQDGLYLAAYLKRLGYDVAGLLPFGTFAEQSRVREIVGEVELCSCDVTDAGALAAVIARVAPDEIYNLAAITSVRVSWDVPARTADINGVGVTRLLEAVRLHDARHPGRVRVFQASSVQMFGEVDDGWYRESTPVRPASPYGAAKAFGHFLADIYRARYGMFVSCGILGNHESPLQDEEFLLQHVCRGAARIARGELDTLRIHNLDGVRDWGYAGDYVRAMHAMLQHSEPADFVIASGRTHSVHDVVVEAFARAGITDWRRHVSVVGANTGQTRIGARGDITNAQEKLGWTPSVGFPELIAAMVRGEDPVGSTNRVAVLPRTAAG